ncbi:Alpha/Beta hydrolase protein [Bisporella sp. PMI_857]|nr:Alpha/Beta hydrolase protein [Bisporella sp. PMI_857]
MSKLFWIGDPKLSSSVILFFHGGGYVLPLSQGHFEWAAHFRRMGLMANKQTCSALLDYSLCPGETYPRQMRQATLALEHLLSIGYSPSQIIVGGDSAGGHLALSLLSHLMYSYPGEAFPVLKLSEKLAGCFLVSPLLSLELDTASYKDNLHADLLSIPVIRDWGEDLFRHSRFKIEKQNGKGWGMALSGDENWWAPLNQVVKRVYLVGGGEELFRDDIINFGVILQGIEGLDSCCHINWKETHDNTFMDYESGVYPSRSTIRLADWVVETLELSH